LRTMAELASRLKLWAMVAALGGTFATIRGIELSLLGGRPSDVIRQVLFIMSAFAGAHLGCSLVAALTGDQ